MIVNSLWSIVNSLWPYAGNQRPPVCQQGGNAKYRWQKAVCAMLLISLSFSQAFAQSTDKNHIVSYTARKSGLTSLSGKPKTDVAVSVSYMDRLGRPIQSIAKEASPNGKDIISFNEYDSYGLQSKQYMPYVGTSTNALYVELSTAKTNQASFFNTSSDKIADDAMPWSTTTIERSPLKRTLDHNTPGSAWENKLTRYEYTFNTSGDNVLEWEITGNGELKLTSSHYYSANTLSVSIIKDSDWTSGNDHTTRTYTNHLGQTILQRTYKDSNPYDTYSVYDEQGNLRFIVPPKAVNELLTGGAASIDDTKVLTSTQTFPSGFAANTTYYYMPGATITLPAGRTFTNGFSLKPYPLNASMVAGLLYINEYDERNRLVSKKVPGAEPVLYVYDNTGRLILSQDGNQRTGNQWTFTKYDQYDRPVLTGLYTDNTRLTREAMQAHVETQFSPTTRYESSGSVVHGYTNNVFPSISNENDYLVVSYYDDYGFKSSWGSTYDFDNANGINNGPNIPIARGLETGGKIKVLGENTWLKSVKYYDYDLQLIQGVSDPYTGQLEKIYSKYSFTGDLLESKFVHTTDGSKEVAIYERYEYDHAGRLEKQYHSIDEEPEVLLAAYEYNELGELVDKKLHSTNGTDFIQSVDYRYNIKGWLTNINKSDRSNFSGDIDGSTDLFGMELYYNTNPSGLSLPATQTNGNLAGTTWGNAQLPSGTTQRSYGYSYDNVNRLTAASYKEKSASAWTVNPGHFDVSGIQYDYNGNITALQRKSANTTIDNLNYTYDGNQLKSINDQTTSDEGFKDGAELSTEYTYDANGNMVSDANKLITSTTYNLLNKPDRITFSNGDYIQYTYDAAGSKLKQEVWISSALADKTEYSSGLIFEDGELSLMSMPQGRVIVEKVADDYNYDYQYFLTDHLGNNRVMFAPQERIYTAGMESENSTIEEAQFLNIASTRNQDAVYSRSGDEAARLNAYDGKIIGPAKGMKLYAGDSVYMETWVKYDTPNSTNQATAGTIHSLLATAYGVSSGGAGELGDIYDGLGDALGSAGLISQAQNDPPAAYLNYIFLDANFENPVGGFVQADVTGGANSAFDSLALTFNATEEGYLFVYLSNESKLDVDVYFDDFQIVHVSDASVLQADDYYPFGLPITDNNYSQTGTKENRFLYQGKEWQTDLALNLYDFHARQYDPATGRFTGVDPRDIFASPYLGMANNPTSFIDPNGEEPISIGLALAIGAAIGGAGYTASVAFSDGGFDNWNWGQFAQSVGIGAATGVASAGIGNVFGHGLGNFGTELARAGAHGLASTAINAGFGNDVSWGSFAIAAGGSFFGSGMRAAGFSDGAMIAGSSVFSGGVAELTGGNFWRGAATGATIAALNHAGNNILQKRRMERLRREYPKRLQFARKMMTWKRMSTGSGVMDGISVGLTSAGMYAGYKELSFINGGLWRGANGKWYSLKWGGNAVAGSRTTVLNSASQFKLLGRATFVGGALISAGQFIDNPTLGQGIQSGTDIGMGALGVWGGPPGAFFSGMYFIDQFIQGVWPGYQQFRHESNRIGFRSHYMGSDGIWVCFEAGTSIYTEDGLINIEDLKEGVKVYSYNFQSNSVELQQISKFFIKDVREIYQIKVGQEQISATAEHPFYVEGKSWVKVKDLKIGDLLKTSDGCTIEISSVTKSSKETTVYNIEVEGNHNYYVTPSKLLVHNKNIVELGYIKGLMKKKEEPKKTGL